MNKVGTVFLQTVTQQARTNQKVMYRKHHTISSNTIYVMGSGISMAHGQSKIGYNDGKLVAVCGDSTFFPYDTTCNNKHCI